MNEVGQLVVRATNPGDQAQRQEAFASLVVRFQDMAFAYAYGVLGDRTLAEDAAQNAFLAAWRNLDALREPDAFAGWFRQILVRQCMSIARTRKLVVALDDAGEPAAMTEEPAALEDRVEARTEVQTLLAELPEHERVVVLLYYIGGHSQIQIAAFLGVSVAAVKQRLYSARRRLRRSGTDTMEENLKENRPSRDDQFAERLGSKLRAFESGDYGMLAGLIDLAEPSHKTDNAGWLANRQRFAGEGLIPVAYVVEHPDTGETIGYGNLEQLAPPVDGSQPSTGVPSTSTFRVHLVVMPGPAAPMVVALLYDHLEQDARSLGAAHLWLRDYAHETVILDGLVQRGFTELRRVQDWRLEVATVRASTSLPDELSVSTLAEERTTNPDYLSDLTEFWNARGTPETHIDEAYSVAEVEERLARPANVPESYFIVREQARIVGVLNLRRPHESASSHPTIRLKVRAEAGGKGIEEGLIAAAVAYARGQHYQSITLYTQTGIIPAQFLVSLGFHLVVEMVVLEKALE